MKTLKEQLEFIKPITKSFRDAVDSLSGYSTEVTEDWKNRLEYYQSIQNTLELLILSHEKAKQTTASSTSKDQYGTPPAS